MKILIIYGTTEGQTRKIARYMEDVLQEVNHQVVIADATEDPPSPEGYDVVMIGSSIHMHKYNNAVVEYATDHAKTLNEKLSVFFSVCLAVASDLPEEHEEAAGIANSFLEKTGWKTNTVWHIAGSLKYTKYDYFKKLIMRYIAKKEGQSVDTSKDHEYTDWEKVKSDVLDFVK